MLQRIAVPVRPGKTDGARRPRGNALLGVVWSFTEVVSKLPPWRDVVRTGCTPSAGKGGGGLEAVAERVVVLISRTRLSSREKDLMVLVEGLVVLKGDSTEKLPAVLEGEKDEGSGSIPARQTAGKTIGGRVLLRLNAKVCGFR